MNFDRSKYFSTARLRLIPILLSLISGIFLLTSCGLFQKKGDLELTTQPYGATIYFDNDSMTVTGTSPTILTGLVSGWHVLRAELEGYHTFSDSVMIKADEKVVMTIIMIPPQAGIQVRSSDDAEVATVRVTTEPPGARVYFDGRNTGYETPVSLFQVHPGTHAVRLKKSGYEDTEINVNAIAGRTSRLTVRLLEQARQSTPSTAPAPAPEPEATDTPPPPPEIRTYGSAQAIVQARQTQLRTCFERVKRRYNRLNGRVTIEFVIHANGSVHDARVISREWSQETFGGEVEQCLLQMISRLPFQEVRRGELRMEMPMIFQ